MESYIACSQPEKLDIIVKRARLLITDTAIIPKLQEILLKLNISAEESDSGFEDLHKVFADKFQ